MRILTGTHKGRVIARPGKIRPTQDKVRKALFDILGDIEGLSFLELYAGSGAVGLEAASRGAAHVVLVEQDRHCLVALRRNIETIKPGDCLVYPMEAEKALARLSRDKRQFELVFLDPPYHKVRRHAAPGAKGYCCTLRSSEAQVRPPRDAGAPPSAEASTAKKTLQSLGACDIVAPNGFVIVQHFKKDELPEAAGALLLWRQSRYGDTLLSFYRKP